jgi:tRNA A-37 threonylcarbamoyl transferase component Bud32
MRLSPRFYEAYNCQLPNLEQKVAERSDSQFRKSIPRKLKLLFHHRVAYAPKLIGNLKWYVRLSSWNEKLETILKEPDEFLGRRAHLLKDGTRSTVGCADGFVLKRFNFKKVSTVIFDLFRSSRGRRGFRTARHLELLKIATPLAIAFADRRQFGFITRSYFVMEEISGSKYLWERGDRKLLVLRLAELLAKLHHEGFSHRDLKETNIILDADNNPHLIDLDALHYVKNISGQRAAVELTRLLEGFSRRTKISTKERIRFLKIYCKCRQIADWRCWWKKIEENLAAGKSK